MLFDDWQYFYTSIHAILLNTFLHFDLLSTGRRVSNSKSIIFKLIIQNSNLSTAIRWKP